MADYEDTAAPQEADDPALTEGQPQQQLSPGDKLAVIMQVPNIAAVLPDDKLGTIASQVIEEYEIDKRSRQKWEERIDEAMDLAMMVAEQKDYPFTKASNIKYPLLTVAALQFNARAYPAVVQGNRVAKCQTWGKDPQGLKAARADRVSEHLSYQLLSELPEWEEDTDKMLLVLPIVGSAFRKVWYDPALKRNRSRLLSSANLVVNYFARSMEDVPRITEEMRLYPYEIAERIRGKRFIEFDYANAGAEPMEQEGRKPTEQSDTQDKDAPHLFLEQHRLLDLDEDGYPEPYVVTVHYSSQKVCRIAANFGPESVTLADDGTISAIRRNDYFVKYQFMPSPDGGFYGWGFGWLLKDIGESINSVLNMMMDAGHLSTVQGGLVSGSLGIKQKTFRVGPGEWKVVNATGGKLSDSLVPITYPGPSDTLFKLLGLLVEAGKEVAAIKDVLTGDTPATAPVGTTLAIIEQGLQVFTSIYKRIHRALKVELGMYAKLNRQHLPPEKYQKFVDGEQPADPQADYADDMDIVPVSDPNSVSKMQKIAKSQLLKEVANENPTMNPMEVTKRVLEAAEIEDIEQLMLPPPQPDPEQEIMLKIAAMLELKERDANISKIEAETVKTQTGAMKDVSDISAAEKGDFMARAKLVFETLKTELQAEQSAEQAQLEAANGQGQLPAVEGQPGNAMGPPMAQGASLGSGGGAEAAPVPVGVQPGPGPMVSTPSVGGP